MQPPASPEQVRLTDLVRRRRQLVDAAAQEKQREPILEQPLVTSYIRSIMLTPVRVVVEPVVFSRRRACAGQPPCCPWEEYPYEKKVAPPLLAARKAIASV